MEGKRLLLSVQGMASCNLSADMPWLPTGFCVVFIVRPPLWLSAYIIGLLKSVDYR